MAAHRACVAKACEPGSRALALGSDLEAVQVPVPEVPEHPFVRARLHIVEPIEASYEPRALEFAAHAKKLKLLCFAEEFDQGRSVLAHEPSRTAGGNATAYPTLEPSRHINVAHSYRMVQLAHDYMLEQESRTSLWSKGPDKVSMPTRANVDARAWHAMHLHFSIFATMVLQCRMPKCHMPAKISTF